MNKESGFTRFLSSCFVLLCIFIFFPQLSFGDDHIVMEKTRTYMGHTRTDKTETWTGDMGAYVKTNRLITIERFDLKKKWTLSPGTKRYLESALGKEEKKDKPGKKERIQETGWRYEPCFHWTLTGIEENRVFEGKNCRVIYLEGVDDYEEETREIWITRDVPVELKRYHDGDFFSKVDRHWPDFRKLIPDLDKGFPVQILRTREPAIAPTMIIKNKAIALEKGTPPEGLYNIPPGYTKCATMEELFPQSPAPGKEDKAYTLPRALQIDLMRLRETWNVLDHCAEGVWAGWDGYRETPFMYDYPNGLRMLVGHPDPTDGFELVPGVEVLGKKVYINREKEIPLKLVPPLRGGGGPIPYGKKNRIRTVHLRMRQVGESRAKLFELDETRSISDRQVLINIHELFHCFQPKIYEYRFGNLNYNNDTNYSVYSEVEGMALEKAYLEPGDLKAREYLEDFITARKLKRRSMNEIEQAQESEEDFMEGTAIYSEVRCLELLGTGYSPAAYSQKDAHFDSFKNRRNLLDTYLAGLKDVRERTLISRGKSYYYGCFQALLLGRFTPGWQDEFQKEPVLLDRMIAGLVDLAPEKEKAVASRLKTRYGIKALKAKHGKLIGERDRAFRLIQKRRGRAYVVNFKALDSYIRSGKDAPAYELGMINLYPSGTGKVKIQDVEFESENTPLVVQELYHVKWVDTRAKPGRKGYELTFEKKEGNDIYYDARFKTAGFTLKAPKIRLKIRPDLIKVFVLEKLKR